MSVLHDGKLLLSRLIDSEPDLADARCAEEGLSTVLPPAVPLSGYDAQRWIQAGVPRWITSLGLTSLWVLTCAISLITDNTQCTASDPSVCGPDPVATAWSVLLFATPILLVWLPVLGCLAGLAYGLADFHYDPVPTSGWAYGLHAVLCGLVAIWLVRSAMQQRSIAEAISGRRTSAPAQPVAARDGRWVAAGWLALAGVALLCWYGHALHTEQSHLHRAVRVVARVMGHTDGGSLILQTVGASQRHLTINVLDETPYPVGSRTPLLLDPQDEHWARLVAEPQDATGWLLAGLAAWLLAAVLAGRAWQWRRGLGSLQFGEQPLLRVRMMLDDDCRAWIMSACDDQCSADPRVIARLAVAPAPEIWQPTDQAEFGLSWREASAAPMAAESAEHLVRDAVVLGDLRDGGVTMLLTADGALQPAGRLRVGRPPARIVDACVQRLRAKLRPSATGGVLTGQPVDASWLREIPEFPLIARPPVRTRALAAVSLLAAFIGIPLAVLILDDLYEQATAVVFGGQLVFAGVTHLLSHVRLDARQLEVSGPVRTHIIPWDRFYGVRQDGDLLLLAWEPDVVSRVGPFEDPAAPMDPRRRQDRASQLGAAMLLQRQRALLSGLPWRSTSRRVSPGASVLLVYLAVMVAVLWRWHH